MLKHAEQVVQSHPVWVCGLKLSISKRKIMVLLVTPCMGVWIETRLPLDRFNGGLVTPCMGVWIETFSLHALQATWRSHPVWVCGLKRSITTMNANAWTSHPVWVCGLKQYHESKPHNVGSVTPCMGVWIETGSWFLKHIRWLCHTLYGCVDWNIITIKLRNRRKSHTLYGCVDWNYGVTSTNNKQEGHTLYGCVDWNFNTII